MRYGHPRPTSDIEYVEIVPGDARDVLERVAGAQSPLAKKHLLHFQHVGVASLPESYAERVVELFPGLFEKLRLFELEAHDLVLSKAVPLDPDVLRARYREELRTIIIGPPETHDQTLQMWIEAYFSA